MTIGLAILIAMILYLIDRNKVWKQAVKTVVVLALLAGIGVGGLFVWSWYQDRKVAREAARVQVQASSIDWEAYKPETPIVKIEPVPESFKKPARPFGNGRVTADSAGLTGSCGADFLTIVSFPTRIEILAS